MAFIKNDFRCFIDLNLKGKIIKLLQANTKKNVHDVGAGENFLGY